jgi:hypothetical protein
MSKKPFFIILFVGALFVAGLILVGMKSLQTQMQENTEVPQPIIEHVPPTPVVVKPVATTTPLVFDAPLIDSLVKSPMLITGKAPGTWYFEASFPVHIEDTEGNILGQGVAQAKGNWMTTEMVPFEMKLTFKKTDAEEGFIVFKKDNPSGDPKHDLEVRVHVLFKMYLQ